MRRILVAILLSGPMAVNAATPAMVDYIIDGDTFAGRVMLDGDVEITVRVRIRNIDTPEIHGQCASEIEMAAQARERLAELIPLNTRVTLDDIKDDKYLGRIDATVADAHGRDVGNLLIDDGLARPYSGGRRMSWCK